MPGKGRQVPARSQRLEYCSRGDGVSHHCSGSTKKTKAPSDLLFRSIFRFVERMGWGDVTRKLFPSKR